MKRYKVNKTLFSIFPLLVISIILLYMVFLFRNSYTWVNVSNLIFDAIILLYYMWHFSYEMSMDSQGINFYTIVGRKRVINSDIISINVSRFLTRIKSVDRRFYIITTFKGSQILISILKDISKATE